MNCTRKICPILRATFQRCPLTYCPANPPDRRWLADEIGSMLRALRCRKGMTQQEVARRTGTYPAKISRYENGYYDGLSEERLLQIAREIDGEAGEQAAREMMCALGDPKSPDFSTWSEDELRAYAERGEIHERFRSREVDGR
jgi:transcriptional regulator with XRE-family HTH domain